MRETAKSVTPRPLGRNCLAPTRSSSSSRTYVSSFDVHSHQLLWEYPWPGRSDTNANVSNAVPLTDSHVFLSKGYGQGAELLQLHVDAIGPLDRELGLETARDAEDEVQ